MTQEEELLLLKLEDVSVESGGLLCKYSLTENEMILLEKWGKEGFIQFGRISPEMFFSQTHFVILSKQAWKACTEIKAQKYLKLFTSRDWRSMEEWRGKKNQFTPFFECDSVEADWPDLEEMSKE